jgi:hypothetical protein
LTCQGLMNHKFTPCYQPMSYDKRCEIPPTPSESAATLPIPPIRNKIK